MACTPTPTRTEYELVTTSTVTTTFSDSVTTIPPDLTTTFTSSCLSSSVDVANDTTVCLSSTTVPVVSTIDEGGVDTVQVPVLLTIPITRAQPTTTLFAPCPSDDSGDDDSSDPPPPPPSQNTITSIPTGPVIVSFTTPPPSVIVSEISSTRSDGSVFVTYMTFTSTAPPTPVYIPTTLAGDSGNNHPSSNASAFDVGPIVGGVLGGFFGLIAIVALIWFIWRKRESLRNRYSTSQFPDYEPTLYTPRPRRNKGSSPPPGLEPKPYEYGLVGRPPSTPSSSPGASPPPTRPQSFSALSAMTAYTPGPIVPLTPPQNSSTPNLLHTSSPVAPTRPITPMTPLSPTRAHLGHPRPSGSEASVGTAVSYPFPVLPPTPGAHEESARGSMAEESVSERRQTRLSLTLANWNPETDGELFPRASEDEGRPASVR